MIIPETFAEGERRVTAIGEGRPGVIHLESNTTGNLAAGLETAEFDARVEANQRRLAAEIRPSYDFIVCGSGSSGSVVAGRLAESGHASVLLLEAGGTDDVPTVREAQQSLANLRSERDWAFQAVPNPLLNGRRLLFSMGKVLGGGSSINAMVWSRGHKDDWDYFAEEAADPGWNYESVLGIYRRIEDWQGTPDPLRRGKGGLVYVEPAHDPNPIAPAMLDAARSLGIPTFDDQNGEMMEGEGGAAIAPAQIRWRQVFGLGAGAAGFREGGQPSQSFRLNSPATRSPPKKPHPTPPASQADREQVRRAELAASTLPPNRTAVGDVLLNGLLAWPALVLVGREREQRLANPPVYDTSRVVGRRIRGSDGHPDRWGSRVRVEWGAIDTQGA